MDKLKSIFLRFVLMIGIVIFFYPTISDAVNNVTESRGIVEYNQVLSKYDSVEVKKIKEQAREYNRRIEELGDAFYHPEKEEGYADCLNPFSDGMMGSLVIEKIAVNLPIYHGTSDAVMQKGVGHLEGTSLPVGGASTHVALSTHSGLPSAKLFTDLYQLEKGDTFTISVLGENLVYRVVRIKTVLPSALEDLQIEEGKDLVTLTTCTPYGINTHRLLVKGERVPSEKVEKITDVTEQARKSIFRSSFKIIAVFMVLILLFFTILLDLWKWNKEKWQ